MIRWCFFIVLIGIVSCNNQEYIFTLHPPSCLRSTIYTPIIYLRKSKNIFIDKHNYRSESLNIIVRSPNAHADTHRFVRVHTTCGFPNTIAPYVANLLQMLPKASSQALHEYVQR